MTDPCFWRGGDRGCLLIHGFSGGPADLRPLADVLVAKGYTVDLPLLPGHGSTPLGAGGMRWQDWVAAVAQHHAELRRMCRDVVIVGYSMGGALAICESAREAPAGLVLLGVPTAIDRDWRIPFIPVFKYFVRWWYPLMEADFDDPLVRASAAKYAPDADLDDPQVREEIRRMARIPTSAIDHFFRITRRARPVVRTIMVPTLVVHGRNDRTAVPACAGEIYRNLGSAQKELLWFERSGHRLIDGVEGPLIVERVVDWIVQHVGEPRAVGAI